jgi:predicted trehalose synthase
MGDLKSAAERVRELAREFVAIKEQFKDEAQQFYLDRLLGDLILGEPEPPFPIK